ncbi:MAG: fimbria/pilus outer membrane usher protein, partial [Thermoanaerobaculia bacterium]
LKYNLDPVDLTLSITADPALLGRNVLELKKAAGVPDRGGDPSIFVNYALSGQKSTTPGLFTEIGASSGQKFAYTGLSRTSAGEVIRGLSYLNFEWPDDMRRLTVGDSYVSTDVLGATVVLGGVTVSRQFSLQPYLIRTPSLDVSGVATTPSTVEVYVNGQLTNRIEVQPGLFTLHDLPVTGGLGNTRIVIRDAFGREIVEQNPFYLSAVALRRGLSDYTFSVGSLRNNLSKSFDYGPSAGLATYRRGITDNLTLGGRAEVSRDVLSGGPSVTLATRGGDIDMQVGASKANGETGTAGALAYRFTTPRYSFGITAASRSDRYATLALTPAMDRIHRDLSVFAATGLGGINFGLNVTRTEPRDSERFNSVTLQATAPVSRFGSVFASVGTARHERRNQPEILLGFTLALGASTTVSGQLQRSAGEDSAHGEVRKPLTRANGYGYALQADTLTGQQLAILQYQTSFGRYELDVDPKRAGDAAYTASGGLVFFGGTARATRAVDDGFALARVGVPGVRVFASNQEVGRTDHNGDLLISNLLPHYSNELRIDDKDIPMEYEVAGTQVSVVPPTRGGVIANFAVRKLRSYTGKMSFLIVGQPYTPALGEIVVEHGSNSPLILSLGRAGEFYVEDLDPGTYKARLRIGKVHCDFPLVLPPSEAGLTDLGVVSCAP